MKQVTFLLFLAINTAAQEKQFVEFSEIFKSYSEKHKNIVVQYNGGFSGQKWKHYRIIFKEKGKWFFVDHFTNPLKLFKDSIVVSECNNCTLIIKQLSKNNNLKSEEEIKVPCRKLTPTLNSNRDSVISEQNLDLITHVGSEILEYRLKKEKKSIWQKTPEVALAICPESMERKVFQEILALIKNVQ